MENKREIWVDNVKVIACIFVVLGHFFQSMVKSSILPDNNLYEWFNTTIYYFHVPLFFMCSGYLYQKLSQITNWQNWMNNVLKKLIALGIPYFVFSAATWGLKKVFSSSVNSEIGGLGYTLFQKPTSPYWYLYILFFIFLITFTIKNKNDMILVVAMGLVFKALGIFGFYTGVYAIDKTMSSEIWFVIGMLLECGIKEKIASWKKMSTFVFAGVTGVLFIVFSVINISFKGFNELMTFMACSSIILFCLKIFEKNEQVKVFGFLAKYTMPIFLMHTLFAAPFRSVLMKIGITNSIAHVILGLLISFVGPVIAMIIMEKLRPLDILVYPNRYIKINVKKGV